MKEKINNNFEGFYLNLRKLKKTLEKVRLLENHHNFKENTKY
jgi:hypothetical protein